MRCRILPPKFLDIPADAPTTAARTLGAHRAARIRLLRERMASLQLPTDSCARLIAARTSPSMRQLLQKHRVAALRFDLFGRRPTLAPRALVLGPATRVMSCSMKKIYTPGDYGLNDRACRIKREICNMNLFTCVNASVILKT